MIEAMNAPTIPPPVAVGQPDREVPDGQAHHHPGEHPHQRSSPIIIIIVVRVDGCAVGATSTRRAGAGRRARRPRSRPRRAHARTPRRCHRPREPARRSAARRGFDARGPPARSRASCPVPRPGAPGTPPAPGRDGRRRGARPLAGASSAPSSSSFVRAIRRVSVELRRRPGSASSSAMSRLSCSNSAAETPPSGSGSVSRLARRRAARSPAGSMSAPTAA